MSFLVVKLKFHDAHFSTILFNRPRLISNSFRLLIQILILLTNPPRDLFSIKYELHVRSGHVTRSTTTCYQ